MHRSPARVRITALAAAALLVAAVVGPPVSTLASAGDPPSIVFAGELLSAPSYDHLILLYSERLDERVTLARDDFKVTVGGTQYTPAAASYLLATGLSLIDDGGSTFVRLDLPAGITVGAASTIQVAYEPGADPIRDLSLTEAPVQVIDAAVVDGGPFAFLGGLVDGVYGADRLGLVFLGQVDEGLLPAEDDFAIDLDGHAVVVNGVRVISEDTGVGLVELALSEAVLDPASVLTVTWTPDTNVFTARNGAATVTDIPPFVATLFLPITARQGTVAGGGSVTTGTGSAPSALDPFATRVTSPQGGFISIDEAPAGPPPTGYSLFGEEVVISAPAATVEDPLVLEFDQDVSLIPLGEDHLSVVVLRNGVPVGPCTGPVGDAVPTPCVSSRLAIGDGDIRITVLTAAASRWSLGVVVPYAFTGFSPPVDGNHVRNSVKAGTAIPVRFGLGGDRGLAILTAGSPSSRRVDCDTTAPIDPIEETVAAGASSLSYSPGIDRYAYVWKTDKAWAGQCRNLVLSFGDGTQASATFQFR